MPRADATEVAQMISELVGNTAAFPDEAVEDLRRLLAHDLGTYNTAQLRLGQLRLVMEMLSASNDTEPFVTADEYEAERKRRAKHGDTHPSDRTLRTNYGHWLKVIDAASLFMRVGGTARITHAPARNGPSQSYKPEEIASALLRCRHNLGDWPTEWEYSEWATIKRALSATNPRLPTPKVIRKAFGSFAGALDTTRANYEASQRAANATERRRAAPQAGREG